MNSLNIVCKCGVTIRTTANEKNIKHSPKIGSLKLNDFSTLIRTTANENFHHIRTIANENFSTLYNARPPPADNK